MQIAPRRRFWLGVGCGRRAAMTADKVVRSLAQLTSEYSHTRVPHLCPHEVQLLHPLSPVVCRYPQDVDRQLKELQDAAAQAGMVAAGAGSDGDSAASPGSAAVGCSASYASWAPPHVAAVLAAGEGAVQQHVRLLQAQQEKLMARVGHGRPGHGVCPCGT